MTLLDGGTRRPTFDRVKQQIIKHLEGVADVTLLDRDGTSWLVLVHYDDGFPHSEAWGEASRAIVYQPFTGLNGTPELLSVKLEDEPYQRGRDFDPALDGCIDDDSPSPIERLLGRRK